MRICKLQEKMFLTEKEATNYVEMSVAWLRKQRQSGEAPAYHKFNTSVRYAVADLDAWASEHKVGPIC